MNTLDPAPQGAWVALGGRLVSQIEFAHRARQGRTPSGGLGCEPKQPASL